MDVGAAYLDEARRSLRGHKRLAEGAIAQVSDAELFSQLDPEANSIAVVMKHITGNMRSRFTDFLTSDGESRGESAIPSSKWTRERRVPS
ncbi:MAG TPA: DUF1572 family protein [Terriglobales bacterium]|nr:DUF1572 family protein [Terriglobales bacterium]